MSIVSDLSEQKEISLEVVRGCEERVQDLYKRIGNRTGKLSEVAHTEELYSVLMLMKKHKKTIEEIEERISGLDLDK